MVGLGRSGKDWRGRRLIVVFDGGFSSGLGGGREEGLGGFETD